MASKSPNPAARQWAPRVWEGSDFFAWLRLLARNRFAVQPKYLYIAAIVTVVSFVQTLLRWLQFGLHGERIRRTPLPEAPIFVLGHWRTGTTLLHELLMLDDRHATPTTLQCFEPCHFLLSRGFVEKYANFILPEKRSMDNMAQGWARPQEDEFALALLGAPSTYTDFAFPVSPPLDPGSLTLEGLAPRDRKRWKRIFAQLIRTIQYADPRRLVLKSPPHTARVPVLLELFPQAKFVHLVRDPVTLFASTVNLWMSVGEKHGFQTPVRNAALEAKVFREFRTIHASYEAAKAAIPAGNLVELRYEEFVKDLVGNMRKVYEGLGLDGFEAVRPKLEEYVARNKGYETNKYTITDEQRAKIVAEWGDIMREQGY
jgi:omega-hydroxy-beta-dihydromenaquinone-9 sulfotransferase